MSEEVREIADIYEGGSFFSAMQANRRRRRKAGKAKRTGEEITALNIVAMVDMMTIILIFMLKSVSSTTTSLSGTDALTLPYSTTMINPVEAVKVFITKDEITVEDKKVAEIHNGIVDSKYLSEKNAYLIPGLEAVLDKEAERQGLFAQANKDIKFQGNVTVLADRDIPYHILMQVLYTAGRAKGGPAGQEVSFSKYRLMVMRSET